MFLIHILQVEGKLGILSWLGIKEEKSRETREQLRSCETREVAYTCRYTSGHVIPTLQCIIMGLHVH